MKKYSIVIDLVLLTLAIYLMFSFSAWGLDPSKWDEAARVFLCFLTIISYAFYYLFKQDNK